MSVCFRVKDQTQAASHSLMYSGVAEAEVQPAVGVRGGVTARCGPLTFRSPFGKSAQIRDDFTGNCHQFEFVHESLGACYLPFWRLQTLAKELRSQALEMLLFLLH